MIHRQKMWFDLIWCCHRNSFHHDLSSTKQPKMFNITVCFSFVFVLARKLYWLVGHLIFEWIKGFCNQTRYTNTWYDKWFKIKRYMEHTEIFGHSSFNINDIMNITNMVCLEGLKLWLTHFGDGKLWANQKER